MSRHNVVPHIQDALAEFSLSELPKIDPVDPFNLTDDEIEAQLEVVDILNRAFALCGCNCHRNKLDVENDPYWAGDLGEFVTRSIPHKLEGDDEPARIVALDLYSLVAEKDDYGVICALTYAEPEVSTDN